MRFKRQLGSAVYVHSAFLLMQTPKYTLNALLPGKYSISCGSQHLFQNAKVFALKSADLSPLWVCCKSEIFIVPHAFSDQLVACSSNEPPVKCIKIVHSGSIFSEQIKITCKSYLLSLNIFLKIPKPNGRFSI